MVRMPSLAWLFGHTRRGARSYSRILSPTMPPYVDDRAVSNLPSGEEKTTVMLRSGVSTVYVDWNVFRSHSWSRFRRAR